MILSDVSIRSYLERGELRIDPFDPSHIQPGSIDCKLGSHFLLLDQSSNPSGCLSLNSPVNYVSQDADEIIVPANSFLLGTTVERIALPKNVSAFVEGRSSIGRIGLFIQNAGWVDAGFEGHITLELYNANSMPIKIQAGRRICQLVFCQMDRPSLEGYQGKYLGQTGTVGSRIHLDHDR